VLECDKSRFATMNDEPSSSQSIRVVLSATAAPAVADETMRPATPDGVAADLANDREGCSWSADSWFVAPVARNMPHWERV